MNKKFIFILWAKWHVANFGMPMWCQFRWHMSSSNLINLMTLIWNLPLNFDVAFCNWLDKFLPPTRPSGGGKLWYGQKHEGQDPRQKGHPFRSTTFNLRRKAIGRRSYSCRLHLQKVDSRHGGSNAGRESYGLGLRRGDPGQRSHGQSVAMDRNLWWVCDVGRLGFGEAGFGDFGWNLWSYFTFLDWYHKLFCDWKPNWRSEVMWFVLIYNFWTRLVLDYQERNWNEILFGLQEIARNEKIIMLRK